MKIKDLQLPRGLNLAVLESLLSEEELESLIDKYALKSRKERKVILPSQSCLRKCMIYHLVEKHKGDFSKVMRILREEEGILVSHGSYITNIKRLYNQRKKEIANE